MGHRALVAYRRPDRRYDLRYSHWGGDELALASRITAGTPLADGAVDAAPLARSVARDRLLAAHLDPRSYEALYLVTRDGSVESYRVCWLEWDGGRDDGRGAIVAVAPGPDDRDLRTWFRATKTVLGDGIEMGCLSRGVARTYLEARIREERGGVPYTYDGDRGGDGRSTPLEDRGDEG